MSAAKNSILDQLPPFAERTAIADLLRAWCRWRGRELMPRRSQIKTNDLPDLMRGMMLLEAQGPDRFIFRFSGSLYQDIYGFDFTGMNYLEITDSSVREIRSRRLWSLVEKPVGAVWTTPSVEGQDFVGVSVPIAPDEPDTVLKIMQVVVPVLGVPGLAAERKRRRQSHVEFSDQFRYIDIGAGKPDSALEA